MKIKDLHPRQVAAACPPGLRVRQTGRYYTYRYRPTAQRYRLLGPKGGDTGEVCLHGWVAVVRALRSVRPTARLEPESGEALAYRALNAIAAGVDVPETLRPSVSRCTCEED